MRMQLLGRLRGHIRTNHANDLSWTSASRIVEKSNLLLKLSSLQFFVIIILVNSDI